MLIITTLIFGYYASPLYPSRLLALAISPMVLKGISRKSTYIPSYVKNFLIVWIFCGFISILWSCDRVNGLKAIFYFFCNIICFFSLYVCALRSNNPSRSILKGWLLLFLLTVPIAIFEFVTDTHLPMAFQDENLSMMSEDGRRIQRDFASVTYGNLNKYNVILCYCLSFILISFFYFKRKIEKVVLFVSLLLVIYIVLMNASRGALLCLVLSVFTVVVLAKFKGYMRIAILLMGLAIFLLVYANKDLFMGQIISRIAESGLTGDDTRINIYSRAITIFLDTLGFGVGIGGVGVALNDAAMHNMYLEFLMQFGLIPFIFYIVFIYRAYKGLWRCKENYLRLLGAILFATIIPVFIINSNYLMDTDLWVFWGSAFALLMIYKRKNTNKMRRI